MLRAHSLWFWGTPDPTPEEIERVLLCTQTTITLVLVERAFLCSQTAVTLVQQFFFCMSVLHKSHSYLLLRFSLSLLYPLPNLEPLQLLRNTKMRSMFLQRLMLSDESIPISSAGYNCVLLSRQQKHKACSLLDLETEILSRMFEMARFWW